jgi:hypothetical protein
MGRFLDIVNNGRGNAAMGTRQRRFDHPDMIQARVSMLASC